MPSFFYTTHNDRIAIQKVNKQFKWMDRPLNFQRLSNAIVIPPADWNNMGAVLDGEGKNIPFACWSDSKFESKLKPDNVEEIHLNLIFIGNLLNMWGHTFTDNLSRVWFLFTAEGKRLLIDGWRVAYVSFEKSVSDSAFEILRLAGVETDNMLRVDVASQFDEVIIPERCFRNSDKKNLLCCREYANLIDVIRNNALIESKGPYPSKLYYTRSGWDSKKDCGEEWRIEKIFENKGYIIVKPQEYPVCQQIAMLFNASELAATDGSLCHNSVFCNENVKLIVLRKGDLVYYYQAWLNFSANIHDIIWIKVHHSIRNNKEFPWAGPFYICPTFWLFLYSKDIRSLFIPLFHKSFWNYTKWIPRGINKLRRVFANN